MSDTNGNVEETTGPNVPSNNTQSSNNETTNITTKITTSTNTTVITLPLTNTKTNADKSNGKLYNDFHQIHYKRLTFSIFLVENLKKIPNRV